MTVFKKLRENRWDCVNITHKDCGGIPVPSMDESYKRLIRLMDDGLTAWKILKENGVRHQTIKNYRYLELKKRMAATESEECEIMRGVRLQEAIEGLDRWSNDIYQELEITEE